MHVLHSGDAQGKGLQEGEGETEWGDWGVRLGGEGVRGCEGKWV